MLRTPKNLYGYEYTRKLYEQKRKDTLRHLHQNITSPHSLLNTIGAYSIEEVFHYKSWQKFICTICYMKNLEERVHIQVHNTLIDQWQKHFKIPDHHEMVRRKLGGIQNNNLYYIGTT